ncbi:MAG: 1-deoxy-D-xylulose-5-phosphate synthase [Bacteroidetes bacterium]|nr:1-deoxy-D-xylulose-5-phosphate synthase [Bacteroidota bacterium]
MKQSLLQDINYPADLKKLTPNQLPKLAQELRDFIIDIVSTKEGHLGASLGVVELTIALHYVFDTPSDLLVWDVGHQAYGHKILTGRKSEFHTNRQFGGIAGFPNRLESEYDVFGVGHASTSISAILGMAMASKLKGDSNKNHIAVIGDASIAAGMAFEGLNHAGVSEANLLVILNDNEMGIDPNVGALKNYLTSVKKGEKLTHQNLFEALNFTYSGPIDGHNLPILINELQRLKSCKGPQFLHVITTKGKGLESAEKDQVKYHAPGKFDKVTGLVYEKKEENGPSKYQDVFGLTLVELAEKNDKIIGITPAMPTGSSMKYMINAFPNRAFDVGIAEQHAVTLAAGFATQGFKPYCAIYSTFAQRAYDQIIHDVALQNLPVIFCLDRAGIVGEDGATHHGVFDLAFLRIIPNMIVFAPLNEIDLRNMLYTVQLGINSPIAIRYPRGKGVKQNWKLPFKAVEMGKGLCIQNGSELAVLTIGSIGNTIIELHDEFPVGKVAHYDMRFVKPLDEALLHQVFSTYKNVITLEDGCVKGGFGSAVLEFANEHNYTKTSIKILGIPDEFIEHGATEELFSSIQLSTNQIKDVILKTLS